MTMMTKFLVLIVISCLGLVSIEAVPDNDESSSYTPRRRIVKTTIIEEEPDYRSSRVSHDIDHVEKNYEDPRERMVYHRHNEPESRYVTEESHNSNYHHPDQYLQKTHYVVNGGRVTRSGDRVDSFESSPSEQVIYHHSDSHPGELRTYVTEETTSRHSVNHPGQRVVLESSSGSSHNRSYRTETEERFENNHNVYGDQEHHELHSRSRDTVGRIVRRAEREPRIDATRTETYHISNQNEHGHMKLQPGAEAAIDRLRNALSKDFKSKPTLFDEQDMNQILRGSNRLLMRYLNQRDFDVGQAHKLAVNVLYWRNKIQIHKPRMASIACDLYKDGLIFEQKVTPLIHGESSPQKPVIWIRLGALGEAVQALKSNAHFSARKAITAKKNVAKLSLNKILDVAKKTASRHAHEPHEISEVELKHDYDPTALMNDASLNLVLTSIAWWLNDWDIKHPEQKANLVLDFEGNNSAFGSSSIGTFFIQLDDRFPDLFDQIIAYRYEPPTSWTLPHKVGYLNRIFFSKVAASDKTNKKIKFVEKKADVETYISDQRSKGTNDIPEHVLKTCVRRSYQVPEFCHLPRDPFESRPDMVDPQLISLIQESLRKC